MTEETPNPPDSPDSPGDPSDGGGGEESIKAAPIDSDPELEHRIELGDQTPTVWVITTDSEGNPVDDD